MPAQNLSTNKYRTRRSELWPSAALDFYLVLRSLKGTGLEVGGSLPARQWEAGSTRTEKVTPPKVTGTGVGPYVLPDVPPRLGEHAFRNSHHHPAWRGCYGTNNLDTAWRSMSQCPNASFFNASNRSISTSPHRDHLCLTRGSVPLPHAAKKQKKAK